MPETAVDRFAQQKTLAEGPANKLFNITPHDTNRLPYLTTAIYVGTGGTLVVRDRESGDLITFKNVSSGSGLPIRVATVMATGTTALDIVGMA